MNSKMTRERVEEIVDAARAKGERPDLSGLDLRVSNLSGVNLTSADLRGADLTSADLRGAILVCADLRGADLRYATLRGAVLTAADLNDANLRGANLTSANLRVSDLRGAILRGANLRGSDLRGADLRNMVLSGLFLDGLPSGELAFVPTPDGWSLTIGCWKGTTDTLRETIAGNDWPEAEGEQIIVRRPMLEAMAYVCDAYAAAHPEALAEAKDAADRWKEGDQ